MIWAKIPQNLFLMTATYIKEEIIKQINTSKTFHMEPCNDIPKKIN